jgi:hypothetical protein
MTWLNGYGISAFWSDPKSCNYVPCPETFGTFPKDKVLPALHPWRHTEVNIPKGMCPVDPKWVPRGKLDFDSFYKLLARYSMHGHERSRGWFFWNFKCEVSDPRWCFDAAYERGWFPQNLSVDAYSPPKPYCGAWDTPMGKLWNTVSIMIACGTGLIFLAMICCCRCAAAQCGLSIGSRPEARQWRTAEESRPSVEISTLNISNNSELRAQLRQANQT